MQHPSSTARLLGASGIREIVNLVVDDPGDIARLEIGEPDSLTPRHITAAAAAAMDGRLGYTQSLGTTVLREAVLERLARVSGIEVPLSRVVIGQGAVQVIAAALAAVLSPGDEVLVPDPAWPNYEMQVTLFGGRPVRYRLEPERGFSPDPEAVIASFGPRTRAIVVNSPSNPAGAVIEAAVLQRIVEAAAERDILVISDEVYDEILFDRPHVGAYAFAPDSVLPVFSFSKTYSMTGWRVGYGVVPASLSVVFERIQETLLSCVSTVSQVAAVAALTGPQDAVAENLARYRRRRDLAVARFAAGGLEVPVPEGAFYLMVPLAPGADSRLAALELVGRGVSTAPGSAFGDAARSHLRLSLASADDTLLTGVDRILDWYERSEGGLALLGASARA